MTDFADWLEEQINLKGWRPAELASRSGLDPGFVNHLLNRKRNPGPKASRAIAHALDLPEEEVFRQAGLLSPKPEDPPGLGEWIRMYVLADEEERDRMLEIAKTLSQRSRKE
jgi:transcriptional regulator with XRE-family HTH domain